MPCPYSLSHSFFKLVLRTDAQRRSFKFQSVKFHPIIEQLKDVTLHHATNHIFKGYQLDFVATVLINFLACT